MNEATKTHLTATALTAAVLATVTALAVPYAGELLAGLAVVAGLAGLAALELKKRVY